MRWESGETDLPATSEFSGCAVWECCSDLDIAIKSRLKLNNTPTEEVSIPILFLGPI